MMFSIDESRLWTFTCLIAATIAVAGCSSQPAAELPDEIASLEQVTAFSADSEPVYEISLNHSVTFTDVDDILLGSWLSAEVDDHDRVFIADHQNTTLRLFNPDGTYNRQIGREGEGPGEYRRISAMRTDNRYLHLMDSNLQRITIFDIETFTEDLDQSEYLVLDNSGELLARFNWQRNSFVQKIKNGHLYMLEEDEDGMRRIVKYEIDLI